MTHVCLFSAPCAFMGDALRGAPFEVRRHEAWSREDLRADPAVTAWITNTGWRFRLGAEDLALFPSLRVVVTPSTGSDHIDVDLLRERGIRFFSLLDDRAGLESISASAEFAFLLLLNTLRRLPHAVEFARKGGWRRDDEDGLRGRELQGRCVGMVGMGRIGRRLSRYCESFGASTAWFDPYVQRAAGERCATLAELFSRSDCVVVCCSLTPETHGMIGGDLVRMLPIGATLVNISRGEVLDEQGVADALRAREDVAVGLDVLSGEPQGRQFESPLVALAGRGRVVVTPHIGGSTVESQTKAARIALGLVARALGCGDAPPGHDAR